MVPLPQEVTSHDATHMQFAPHILRVDVSAYIFPGHSGRTHVERAAVSQHVVNLVGQREAQIIHAEVPIHVLERKHGDGATAGARAHAAMLKPPRPRAASTAIKSPAIPSSRYFCHALEVWNALVATRNDASREFVLTDPDSACFFNRCRSAFIKVALA